MIIDEIYRVKIIGLDHQGRGIGKIKGLTIFIPNSLIGETIDFKLTKIRKKYLEGEVVNIIKQSVNRIKPICQYFI